jgi:hypothetical protein
MNSKIKSTEVPLIHNNVWGSSKQRKKLSSSSEEEFKPKQIHLSEKDGLDGQTENQMCITYYQMKGLMEEHRAFTFDLFTNLNTVGLSINRNDASKNKLNEVKTSHFDRKLEDDLKKEIISKRLKWVRSVKESKSADVSGRICFILKVLIILMLSLCLIVTFALFINLSYTPSGQLMIKATKKSIATTFSNISTYAVSSFWTSIMYIVDLFGSLISAIVQLIQGIGLLNVAMIEFLYELYGTLSGTGDGTSFFTIAESPDGQVIWSF